MNAMNLLPWRETKRHQQRRRFRLHVLLSALSGLGVIAIGYGNQEYRLQQQRARVDFLTQEHRALQQRLEETQASQQSLLDSEKRHHHFQQVRKACFQAQSIHQDLLAAIPDAVYFNQLDMNVSALRLTGHAQQNTLSAFLAKLGKTNSLLGAHIASVERMDDTNGQMSFAIEIPLNLNHDHDAPLTTTR